MEYNDKYGTIFINREAGVEPDIAEDVVINGLIDCIHKVTVEKDVFTGHDVKILTGGHDPDQFGHARKISYGGGPVTIREGAWIASFAILIGPCEIGKHAVVGAGSVVTHDVSPYTLVAGNPAKIIRAIPEGEKP